MLLLAAIAVQTVIFVHRTLTEAGYRAVLLHGKRSQQEREAAVADFKAGKSQVRPTHPVCGHVRE
jgi:superfamily II DNA/RNA helicase